MPVDKILVIGSEGQIGTVLSKELQKIYGSANVIKTDIKSPLHGDQDNFELLDILDGEKLNRIVKKHNITQIYHLAAMLSAKGEQKPDLAWDINMNGYMNVLKVAVQEKIKKIYFPSSIAVFGGQTPKVNTPQHTILEPQTMYGITKEVGEQLSHYYCLKYDMDIRSIRYPGIISYETLPGGGTTDYAVDIFHKAIAGDHFSCFLDRDTALPMMYMPDAVRATLELMEAPKDYITIHYGYNVHAMSFTPSVLAAEIQKHIPAFSISYAPDFRQQIAESWIQNMDDTAARNDWGWKEAFDIESMTKDMLINLRRIKESTNSEQDNTITI